MSIRSRVGRLLSSVKRVHPARMPGTHAPAPSSASQPYPQLAQLVEAFRTDHHPPEVLYLGDSVLERTSRVDGDPRTLGEILAADLAGRLSVTSISHSAYHMRVFNGLVRALERLPGRPKIVILPVNMRSFSPQWDLNPLWQFESEMRAIEQFVADPASGVPVANELRETPGLFRVFDATSVAYPGTALSRVGQFRKIISSSPRTQEQKEYRLRQIFIFHYMHPLSPDHPKVALLADTLGLLRRMGSAALVYVTPVNYQAGERLVGNAFLASLTKNVQVITRMLASHQASGQTYALDCSTMLSSDYFFHRDNATEHLNQEGRQLLAKTIAEALLGVPGEADGRA